VKKKMGSNWVFLTGFLSFSTSGAGSAVITIDPANDFLAGENIFLTVTTGVESLGGQSLATGETFRFTTSVTSAYEDPPILAERTIFSSSGFMRAAFAADIDSDGDIDIISAENTAIKWHENDGSENFTSHTVGSVSTTFPIQIHASDFENDGDIDIVTQTVSGDEIVWFENDGSENFTSHSVVSSVNAPYGLNTVDLNSDGFTDIISAIESEDRIAWYENDGSQNFTARDVNTSDHNSPRSVFGVDMDDDGDVDVVVASLIDDKVGWHENDGSENFTFHEITTTADGAWTVYAIDVDGDNDVDVLSGSWYDDKIAWYENDGNENFTTHVISTNADQPNSVFAADVDGDSDIDVLSASESDDKVAWYENDGNENFSEHIISDGLVATEFVYAVDINSDGRVDVLSLSTSGKKVVWFENKVNSPPQLDNPIADQAASAYIPYSFTFAENTFSDPDGSELLTYSATLSDDSPLPSWLSFDGSQKRFSGTADPGDAGTITIKVKAEDPPGASATDEFDLVVSVPSLMSITASNPDPNELDVTRNSNIRITFDETKKS
ncbi:MAG: FG-GAP-like repeat-containing protein, partial [Proteobacteria bacterium]|nr:FG-GAP-like repeat-containing protein [Pseudomonadota bacterium]